jgi:NAD(P)-dependent dehydrogenase (short-subunit alcohol dehydrogenase family)
MGRNALVTGAASGIGKALVQQLVGQGVTGLTVSL